MGSAGIPSGGDARELKRVVIKEEFVALTGDHVKAAILDRFDQRQKQVEDFDRFIREEKARALAGGGEVNIGETGGWIYKEAAELVEETMLNVSERTINRRVEELVQSGLLIRRRNPKHQWDRTWQYRLDLFALRAALAELGYVLEGWFLPPGGDSERVALANDTVTLGNDGVSLPGDTEAFGSDAVSSRKGQSGASNGHSGAAIPVGLIDDLDLPSVDQSVDQTDRQTEENKEQEDQAPPPGSKAEALLNEIRGMAEEQVGEEAEDMAGLLVARFGDEGYELDEADTAKLTQLCLQEGRRNTLMRVAERVAKKEKVDHPFRYLVKSVAEEPAESGLAARVRERAAGGAPRSGAERRREGYEWLFGEGS